jgi:hypothetical protein
MKMTHAQWMKDTAAFGRVRSTELTKLDAALLAYERALANSNGSVLQEKRNLQQALEHWKTAQKAKGQDWRTSVRNKQKAVELLDGELGMVIVGAGGLNSRGELMIDSSELEARRIIANHIRDNTRLLFSGAELTFKTLKALNDVRGAQKDFKEAARTAGGIGTPPAPNPGLNQQLASLLGKVFGDAAPGEVQNALGPSFAEFLSSATPFVGAIKSGGSAIMKWGQAAKGLYDKSKLEGATHSFAPGDPTAAFEAIVRIQTAEIQQNVVSAGIYTTSAALKAAFTAADFGAVSGPIMGAAEKFALLVQKIYIFGYQWNEMKAGNALLKAGKYDLTLFKASPLLGCYLIANSNTSDIINMAVGDYGKVGWKFEVEIMVKKAEPVFAKAREVIKSSSFEIKSMSGMKGVVADRTKKTLGVLPTGKLDGLVEDVSKKIKSVIE